MIELTEATVGIWFVSVNEEQDWMAALNDGGDKWELTYRHRYYTDKEQEGFFNNDKKNWYQMSLQKENHPTAISACVVVRQAAAQLAAMGNHDAFVDELRRDDKTMEEFAEELMLKPWASAQRVH